MVDSVPSGTIVHNLNFNKIFNHLEYSCVNEIEHDVLSDVNQPCAEFLKFPAEQLRFDFVLHGKEIFKLILVCA